MARRERTPVWLARLAAIGLIGATAAGAAFAEADLVVVRDASRVRFESCDERQPLVEGEIAIRNIGDSRARMRLGIVTRYTRSLLAVYVPQHLDMVDFAKERSAMDPGDQEMISFSLGRRVVKKGRFGDVATDSALLDIESLRASDRRDIQRALRALGHYRGAIDGELGFRWRAAVTAYQASLNQRSTGVLTVSQTIELARSSGRPLSLGASPTEAGATRIPVTIYAVVDPYNLVRESDESNNLVEFKGEILCD